MLEEGGSKEANKVRYANILTGYSPQCLLNKGHRHPLRLRFHFPADTYGQLYIPKTQHCLYYPTSFLARILPFPLHITAHLIFFQIIYKQDTSRQQQYTSQIHHPHLRSVVRPRSQKSTAQSATTRQLLVAKEKCVLPFGKGLPGVPGSQWLKLDVR